MNYDEAVAVFKKYGNVDVESISKDDLKNVYKKLVIKYHPDKNPNVNTGDILATINVANEILQQELSKFSGKDSFEDKKDSIFSNIENILNKLKSDFVDNAQEIYDNWLKDSVYNMSEAEMYDMISKRICKIIKQHTNLSCIVKKNDEEGEDTLVYVYDSNVDKNIVFWVDMSIKNSKFSPDRVFFIRKSPRFVKDYLFRNQNR